MTFISSLVEVGPREALLSTWIAFRFASCPSQMQNSPGIELATQARLLRTAFDLCPLCRGLTRGTKTSSGLCSSLRPLQMFPTQRKRWEERKVEGCSQILQARTFYQSCVRERETTAPADLFNLQKVLEFAGGWELSGTQNESMLLSERMFRLQNQLGLSLSPPHSPFYIFQACLSSSLGG